MSAKIVLRLSTLPLTHYHLFFYVKIFVEILQTKENVQIIKFSSMGVRKVNPSMK